jgi:hypothetical protein
MGELDQEAGETMLQECPEVVKAIFFHVVSDQIDLPPVTPPLRSVSMDNHSYSLKHMLVRQWMPFNWDLWALKGWNQSFKLLQKNLHRFQE